MRMAVCLIIAMHLYNRLSLGHVLQKLAKGTLDRPDPTYPLPGESAIACRRYQLGAPP